MLNTYLRDFVNTSLIDWVDFIKTFTLPKYEDGELWKRSSTPMIVINLKEKKQKKKGSNTIEYSPSLVECAEFMTSALKKIQDSTNAVLTFENDLMTFLELDSSPTFRLTADFPWVADALQSIEKMIAENEVDPERLLEQYKKYENVLNTDKKALQKDLFEYKPPFVEPVVEDKKKPEVVIETPRSGETPREGEEVKVEEVVEVVVEEVYVKPAGKQSLDDIRDQIQIFY
jgi:hypothetical protein